MGSRNGNHIFGYLLYIGIYSNISRDSESTDSNRNGDTFFGLWNIPRLQIN